MVEHDRIRVEQGHKRVRGFVGGELVFDTVRPMLVWEVPYYPAYYVPADDVAGESVAGAAGLRYATSPIPELRDLVRFNWADIDEWFEEDEPIYTHPRDPYTRVDVLASSRHVRVEVGGVTVAETSSPRILFETGLPARYYLPLTDVRLALFHDSPTRSHCPYKGEASYWSLQLDGKTYDDFLWCYRSPFPESQKVAGLGCFYNEKVDLYLDNVLQDRPRTHFG